MNSPEDSETEYGWAAGDAIREARGDRSVFKISAENGLSHTRWGDVERGYRMLNGQKVAVKTTADTLARMALAVGLAPVEIVEIAGYDPYDIDDRLVSTENLARSEINASLREATPEELKVIDEMVTLFLKRQRVGRPRNYKT